MDNKVLVVLGMHRSGTSLIAQWLQKCGLNMGDQLHGADIGNPEGHFEDVDFLNLHEGILKFYDLSTVGLISHPVRDINDRFITEMTDLVQHKNNAHIQWGWKEPRTCLFLSNYRSILSNAKYFIVVRDYNEVVSSLIKRNLKSWQKKHFLDKEFNSVIEDFLYKKIWTLTKYKKNLIAHLSKYGEQYLKTWICYNEELLKHIHNIKKEDAVVCDLSMLLQNPKDIFLWLKEEWRFDMDYYSFGSLYKKELITGHTDITAFIKNKALIEKANALQLEFKKHLFNYKNTKQLIA